MWILNLPAGRSFRSSKERENMEKVYRYGLFPFSLACYIFAGFYATRVGMDKTTYNILVYGSLIFFGLYLERLDPYMKSKTDKTRLGADVLTVIFNAAIVAKIGGAIVTVGFIWLADHYFNWISWGPLWLQVILALLIVEFTRYWVHRLQHEVDFLWKWHAIHHSVPKTYSLNGLYAHPVDFLLRNVVTLLIPTMLGFSGDAIFVSTVILTVTGFFTHANLPLQYGWLEYIAASPRLHRWHHSTLLHESNANYGVGFILFDRIFGTLYDPKDKECPLEMGVEGLSMPKHNTGALFWKSLRGT